MIGQVSAYEQTLTFSQLTTPNQTITQVTYSERRDTVAFGLNGPVGNRQAMDMVMERAYQKLQRVVADARAALGLPEGATVDTSPEATANRIADFALGAYDAWRANHAGLGEEEAREQFIEFIGAAVTQGIQEARDILGALRSLTEEVAGNIDRTAELVWQRFDQFLQQGSSAQDDGLIFAA